MWLMRLPRLLLWVVVLLLQVLLLPSGCSCGCCCCGGRWQGACLPGAWLPGPSDPLLLLLCWLGPRLLLLSGWWCWWWHLGRLDR